MIESDEVRMLVDLGFVAVTRGLDKQAQAIFEGVRAVRPNEDAAYIGQALLLIQQNNLSGAVKILRSRPPSDGIRLFLGMSLLRLGDISDAMDVLQDVVKTAREPAMVEMAKVLLASAGEGPNLLALR